MEKNNKVPRYQVHMTVTRRERKEIELNNLMRKKKYGVSTSAVVKKFLQSSDDRIMFLLGYLPKKSEFKENSKDRKER